MRKHLAPADETEIPYSGLPKRTGNISRGRDSLLVERWAVLAYLLSEKRFRRIDVHQGPGVQAPFPNALEKTSRRMRFRPGGWKSASP